jgi:hypothetical protein
MTVINDIDDVLVVSQRLVYTINGGKRPIDAYFEICYEQQHLLTT